MSVNNSTTSGVYGVGESRARDSFELFRTLMFACIFIVSIVGNSFVVLTILKIKQLRTMCSIFLLNLSLCDIALVSLSIPPTLIDEKLGYFSYGSVACKLLWPFATFSVISGSLTLLLIAIERYLAIVHSFTHRRSKKHAVWALLVLHLASICSVVPYMLDLKMEKDTQGNFQCKETWKPKQRRIYTLFLFLIQYGIPLPLMSFFYIAAWRSLRDRNNETIRMVRPDIPKKVSKISLWRSAHIFSRLCICSDGSKCPLEKRNELSYSDRICSKRAKQTLKALRKFICVVVVFTVFNLPNQITWLFVDFSNANGLDEKVKTIFYMLTYTNSVINPWIYGGLDSSFRDAYKKILSCKGNENGNRQTTALKRKAPLREARKNLLNADHTKRISTLQFVQDGDLKDIDLPVLTVDEGATDFVDRLRREREQLCHSEKEEDKINILVRENDN